MKEYLVELDAHTTVEAENREEAESKAEELAWQRPDEVEVTGGSAQPLGEPDQEYFFAHIREVGHVHRSTGYKPIEGKSALEVAFRTSNTICRDLIGPEDAAALRFYLGCYLISTVEVSEDRIVDTVRGINGKASQIADDVDGDPFTAMAGTDFVIKSREDEVDENLVPDLPSGGTKETTDDGDGE